MTQTKNRLLGFFEIYLNTFQMTIIIFHSAHLYHSDHSTSLREILQRHSRCEIYAGPCQPEHSVTNFRHMYDARVSLLALVHPPLPDRCSPAIDWLAVQWVQCWKGIPEHGLAWRLQQNKQGKLYGKKPKQTIFPENDHYAGGSTYQSMWKINLRSTKTADCRSKQVIWTEKFFRM